MTKSLLDEVAENARFIAPCPACSNTPGLSDSASNQMGPGPNGLHKRGRWQGLPRNGWPVCRFCRGQKVVYLNRICECAMPAMLYEAKRKLWFCGSEECAKSRAWRMGLQASSGAAGPAGPMSWHGMGG